MSHSCCFQQGFIPFSPARYIEEISENLKKKLSLNHDKEIFWKICTINYVSRGEISLHAYHFDKSATFIETLVYSSPNPCQISEKNPSGQIKEKRPEL